MENLFDVQLVIEMCELSVISAVCVCLWGEVRVFVCV